MAKQLSNRNWRTDIKSYEPYDFPVPRIYDKWRIGESTEWSNYISHPTPTNPNRREWHNSYITELLHMYDIVANTIDERYPKNKIRWGNNEKVAHNLSRLIYHCSSKQLPKD